MNQHHQLTIEQIENAINTIEVASSIVPEVAREQSTADLRVTDLQHNLELNVNITGKHMKELGRKLQQRLRERRQVKDLLSICQHIAADSQLKKSVASIRDKLLNLSCRHYSPRTSDGLAF